MRRVIVGKVISIWSVLLRRWPISFGVPHDSVVPVMLYTTGISFKFARRPPISLARLGDSLQSTLDIEKKEIQR